MEVGFSVYAIPPNRICRTMQNELIKYALDGLNGNSEMPRWNPWAVLLKGGSLRNLLGAYRELISSASISVDYFCPLPTSGFMLIPTVLDAMNIDAITYKKPSSSFDSPYFENEEKIRRGARVLLVDTTINIGDALATANRQMKRINAEISDVAVIVYNDIAIKQYPSRLSLLQGVRLHYLLAVSELLSVTG